VALRWFTRCLLAMALASAVLACSDPDATPPGPTCSPDGTPIHLSSRLDDDDGDGNPADEDFPDINDEDDDIADHAWARDANGTWHLFFQNEGLAGPNAIEHYTTRDLQTLEYVGVALQPSEAGWDSGGLWAPHVVQVGSTWFLFYTGVSGKAAQAHQRIGIATSTDLTHWTRVASTVPVPGDGCVYECRESWTTWGSGADYADQCRDPFVLWDADHERWTLFATARSTNGFGVVTVATATDLQHWSGTGYIDASRRLDSGIEAQRTGGEAENPFIMQHDGTWFLLFTDWRDPEDMWPQKAPRTIVQYATSSTLRATPDGSPHWIYRGYTPDPGVNAIEVQRLGEIWLMSQSISNESSGVPELRRTLRLMCVSWVGESGFTTVPFHCCDAEDVAASSPARLPTATTSTRHASPGL
jgi:hypothetical protein